jgi:hypothetical protein
MNSKIFLYLLSILFSYVSYQCLMMLKKRVEISNLPGIVHGAGGLNYDSPLIFFPIFVIFICPTISIYLYLGSESLWMLLVYLILNMVFYNTLGSLMLSSIFKTIGINYLNPRNKKNIIIVNVLSLCSVLALLIAFFT